MGHFMFGCRKYKKARCLVGIFPSIIGENRGKVYGTSVLFAII